TATGDPAGEDPDLELVVHLRTADATRAELRIQVELSAAARLALQGSVGSLTLEYDPPRLGEARLLEHQGPHPAEPVELPPCDPREAILAVLSSSIGRRDAGEPPSPNLLDGTRAMELSEAVNRSLRRGRTVEMHYESISEEATFKSVMTSTGCL